MNWVPVFTQSVPHHPYPSIKIPHSFTSPVIAIYSAASNAQRSWRRAGWMYPVMELAGISDPAQGVGRRVNLGTQILRFDSLGLPFTAEFYPVGWVTGVTLICWEPDPPMSEVIDPVVGLKLDSIDAKLNLFIE